CSLLISGVRFRGPMREKPVSASEGRVALVEMLGGKGVPIFLVRVGRGFALHFGNGFFDLARGMAAPGLETLGVGPTALEQLPLRNLQTIAPEDRLLKPRISDSDTD